MKLEKEIQLSPDSGTIVQHGMFTKKVRITARGADGKVYSIKYKPINYAQVMILNKDTAHLKLTIVPGPQPLEGTLTKVAEYGSRFLDDAAPGKRAVLVDRRYDVEWLRSGGW